ncbi:MAG: transcription termination factor Rho [Planctomycetes bacterium]|nr:transcription termination factor Rho [Planctomycetota bacterium]
MSEGNGGSGNGGGGKRRRRRRRRRGGSGGGGGESNRDSHRESGRASGRQPSPGADGGDDDADGGDTVEGLLFVAKDGFGFLRQRKNNYLSGSGDPFVPAGLVKRNRLKVGQFVEARIARGGRNKRKRPVDRIVSVDGDPPEVAKRRPDFRGMVSINPNRRIVLETRDNDPTLRIVDLATPIGFGQRYLIVAPPRTGKTVILHKLANAISENHPETKVIVLLVDERPEEVTDFTRSCTKAEVIASSLDMDAVAHVNISEMVLDRVKRLAEAGQDVVVLIDSMTRMARAFNTERGRSGRTLSGGLDSSAMQKPRELFGAARCFEGGGSITNIATVLVDTGSKMDQVIFEEFKGTGNAELILDRDLADMRVFPAINIKDSGTRREEYLRDPHEFQLINLMRRALVRSSTQRAMEALLTQVRNTSSNAELLLMLQKQSVY